jgi:uncharacterized membrane protein YhaH (DUF805 family)/uncharacterized membrane protein YphA (DoxX/SURF4 family)
MKYAIWFVRLLFAAWMIPAGINHFYPLFPQPMGSQPLSMELIRALLASHLFDLVKAVELIAGVGVLFGYYTPLMLLICLPVSFNVFYWDAPLEGWGSRAAIFGYSTFASNLVLCFAYCRSYLPAFALRTVPTQSWARLGRVVFGIWMLLNGANYLVLSWWAMPSGTEPLAVQLMTSLMNSHLLAVAMAMQVVLGALILAGVFVPAALALLMAISTCAVFWAVLLEHSALHGLLALVAFALNGLLMLAYLPYYKGVLARHALAVAEHVGSGSYDGSMVNPNGRATRADFLAALVVVLAAIAFFAFVVTGRTAHFCMWFLMYPLFVLLARRLRDLGIPAWLLLAPLVITMAAFASKLGYVNAGESLNGLLPWIALAATAAFAAWGCAKK